MATFSVTIPDAEVPVLEEAFCASYGYQEEIPNPEPQDAATPDPEWTPTIPNPQSKQEFTQARIVAYMHEVVRGYAVNKAVAAAQEAAAAQTPPDVQVEIV